MARAACYPAPLLRPVLLWLVRPPLQQRLAQRLAQRRPLLVSQLGLPPLLARRKAPMMQLLCPAEQAVQRWTLQHRRRCQMGWKVAWLAALLAAIQRSLLPT